MLNFSYNSDHCNISGNNASNNNYGIVLSSSSDNTLRNNIVNSNDDDGISLSYSNDNTLSDNTVNSNTYYGIRMSFSSSNTLAGNTMSGNTYNFGVWGQSLSSYTQSIDASNMVDGKPIHYLVGQQDKQIPGDAGFVGAVNCTNTTVKDLTLTNNMQGVLFAYTENSRIENVNASNNYYGILLSLSSSNMLHGNTASNNDWYGIYIVGSSGNTIYHNHLIDNTQNAYDDSGTNQWDSGSEGNYWSNYNGTDNNTDGIGDDPYDIPGGESVDRYPLMRPWTGDTSQKGDLNHDGNVTPADAAIALRIAATGAQNPAAAVSGDNRVTSLDALIILQAAAGRIEL